MEKKAEQDQEKRMGKRIACIAIGGYVFASVSICLFFSHWILNSQRMGAITSAALQLPDPNSVNSVIHREIICFVF